MIDYKALKRVLNECGNKDIAVYVCLLTFNGKGCCFPTRKAISERLGNANIRGISESIHRLEEKKFIKRELKSGRGSVYQFLNNNENEFAASSFVEDHRIPYAEHDLTPSCKNQEIPSAEKHQIPSAEKHQIPSAEKHQIPSAEKHQIPSSEKHYTPLSKNDHTPMLKNDNTPCEKSVTPPSLKSCSFPENTRQISNAHFLKENIKGKLKENGNINQKLLSNPFYKPLLEFLEYFHKQYEKKLETKYYTNNNYGEKIMILKILEHNFSLEELKKRCEVFFYRNGWWAREENYTIGAFACDNVFNTLIFTEKERRDRQENERRINYPRKMPI
jgi:hypothetical protein